MKEKGMSLAQRWAEDDAPFNILEEPEEETKKSFTILKSDSDKRLVFGWASIAITVDGEVLEDRQGDMIDPEDLEEAAYEYVLYFRDTGEEHLPGYRKKGKLVESVVLTKEKQHAMGIPEGILPVGWWLGFYIEDDDAWERVKNGTYRMFSIEGKANREPVEKSTRTARSFDEIRKYNHNHGPDGKFSESPGSGGAKDISATFKYDASKGGTPSQQVAEQQGYLEKPRRVSSQEFISAVKETGTVGFRSWADKEKSAEEYRRELTEAEPENFKLGHEGGVNFGGGIYVAMTEPTPGKTPTAKDMKRTLDASRRYGHTSSAVTLAKDAKIGNGFKLADELKNLPEEDLARFGRDVGAYAASKGYDAIRFKGAGGLKEHSYTTVLNRSKLIVLEEKASDSLVGALL